MTKIIYEDNHLLVVLKPVNMPVCEDESQDLDLLNHLKNYIKIKHSKPGNVYLGLVHRLDRPVSGIMVFAKTSKAASRLAKQIQNKEFIKEYHAIVSGKIVQKGEYHDKILKDNKTNISKISPQGKECSLSYERVSYDENNDYSLVKINLETGRSHQIRVQFSYHSHPLIGDQKYNSNTSKIPVCLFASKLSFEHPITKEKLTFEEKLPSTFPWNLF